MSYDPTDPSVDTRWMARQVVADQVLQTKVVKAVAAIVTPGLGQKELARKSLRGMPIGTIPIFDERHQYAGLVHDSKIRPLTANRVMKAKGKTTIGAFDQSGKLLGVIDADDLTVPGKGEHVSYDSQGNAIAIVDANGKERVKIASAKSTPGFNGEADADADSRARDEAATVAAAAPTDVPGTPIAVAKGNEFNATALMNALASYWAQGVVAKSLAKSMTPAEAALRGRLSLSGGQRQTFDARLRLCSPESRARVLKSNVIRQHANGLDGQAVINACATPISPGTRRIALLATAPTMVHKACGPQPAVAGARFCVNCGRGLREHN